MADTPLDDRDADWIAVFWASMTTVHWPVRTPDALILGRLKVEYAVGKYADDDPYPHLPYEDAGFRLPAPKGRYDDVTQTWDEGG
jgi:hypothetical protein